VVRRTERPWSREGTRNRFVWLLLALGVVYLATILFRLPPVTSQIDAVRALSGLLLLLFVPGYLLTRLVGIGPGTIGLQVLFAVGLSVAALTLFSVVVGGIVAALGRPPLGFDALALAVSLALAGLVALAYQTGTRVPVPSIDRETAVRDIPLLVIPPAFAVVAALWMRYTRSSLLMALFVGSLLVIVLVVGTGRVSPRIYPPLLFGIALSVGLHRNLVTGHLVGADVQAHYAVARVFRGGVQWAPEIVGQLTSIPAVTLTPAVLSTLTGVDLATVFTVVYPFLFALVPLAVYYLGRQVFDPTVAVFGSLFLVFYHGSFYFTPGKQLIAELFVALLLLTILGTGARGWRRGLLVALLSVGLVFSHYAVTFVFGLSLLGAAIALAVIRRMAPSFDGGLSVGYAVALLAAGTVWYWFASTDLFLTLTAVPVGLADQIQALVTGGTITGSGRSYSQSASSLLDRTRVLLYLCLTGLVAVGVLARTLVSGRAIYRGHRPVAPEYTALAGPFLGFLVVSYFLTLNLWADRAYQLTLVVLAPFMAYGFAVLVDLGRTIVPPFRNAPATPWLVLAVALATLFALNSGLAYALAGTAQSSTFNPDANDRAFVTGERHGVEWLQRHGGIERTETYQSTTGTHLAVDHSERVQIYTDPVSYQLFRALLPASQYNVEHVLLKNRWRPSLDTATIDGGYVYIRTRSLRQAGVAEPVPPTALSTAERNRIVTGRNVVYDNGAVTIVQAPDRQAGDGRETVSHRSSPPVIRPGRLTHPEHTGGDR